MGRWVRLVSLAALAATLVLLGSPGPAGARGNGPMMTFVVQKAAILATDAVPNTNVTGKLSFQPGRLKTHWTGTQPGTCAIAIAGATVTNKTRKTITLMADGKVFFTLPGYAVGGICGWGSGKSWFEFGLDGSTKTLRVRFT
jgi:hypothetical protein